MNKSPRLLYLLCILCIAPLLSGCFYGEILYSSIEPRPKIKRWTIKHEGHKLTCYSKKRLDYPMNNSGGVDGFLSFDGTMFPMDFEYHHPGNPPHGEVIHLPKDLERIHSTADPIYPNNPLPYLIIPAESFDSGEFTQLTNMIIARYPEIMTLTQKHCNNLARNGSFNPLRHMRRLHGTIRKRTKIQE